MRYSYYRTSLVIVTTPPWGDSFYYFRDALCACSSVTLTMFNYLNVIIIMPTIVLIKSCKIVRLYIAITISFLNFYIKGYRMHTSTCKNNGTLSGSGQGWQISGARGYNIPTLQLRIIYIVQCRIV